MTNPADIQKEVAEKISALLKTENVSVWADGIANIGGHVIDYDGILELLRAALQAEAGERAKLEAERNEERRMRIVAERMETLAERRASTEAERARGLEAQLETATGLLRRFRDKLKVVLPIVDSMVTLQFARTGTRYIGPNLAEEMNEADAALSQLPTPKKV